MNATNHLELVQALRELNLTDVEVVRLLQANRASPLLVRQRIADALAVILRERARAVAVELTEGAAK